MAENRYADIIDRERPVHADDDFARRHPRMPQADRAKIFLPFAALKSFGEIVSRERYVYDRDSELAEDQMEEIRSSLSECALRLEKGESFSVRAEYFEYMAHGSHNPFSDGEGRKSEIKGRVTKMDPSGGWLQVGDLRIAFENLRQLTVLDGMEE